MQINEFVDLFFVLPLFLGKEKLQNKILKTYESLFMTQSKGAKKVKVRLRKKKKEASSLRRSGKGSKGLKKKDNEKSLSEISRTLF